MDKPTSFQHSFTTAMDDQWDSLIEYAYDKDAVGTTYFVPTSGFEEPVFDDWRVSTQLLGCDDADLGLSYGYESLSSPSWGYDSIESTPEEMIDSILRDVEMPELTVTSPNCAHSLVLSDEEPTMYSIKLEIEEFFDLDYSPPQSAEAHDGIPGSESPESLRSESPHSGRSLSPLSTCSKTASSEAVHDASEEHICPEQTCRRNFRRANALQRHIASIHEKTGVKCPFCEEAKRLFNRSDNFQRHVASRHKEVEAHDEKLQASLMKLYQGNGRRTSWKKPCSQ